MTRCRVRIVLPIERYGDAQGRKAIAEWLERVLTPRIAGVEVTHRADQGVVIVAGFAGDLGALGAAAGILELIAQTVDNELGNRRELRRYLASMNYASVQVTGAR